MDPPKKGMLSLDSCVARYNIPLKNPIPVTRYEKNPELSPVTPWKINMEPTNHPFRKEHDLPNLHDYVPC